LEFMSEIWKIYDKFPISYSDFVPYWNTDVKVSDDRIKVTYYRYTDIDGSRQLLAFCANIMAEEANDVNIDFGSEYKTVIDVSHGNAKIDGKCAFEGLGYKILYVK